MIAMGSALVWMRMAPIHAASTPVAVVCFSTEAPIGTSDSFPLGAICHCKGNDLDWEEVGAKD